MAIPPADTSAKTAASVVPGPFTKYAVPKVRDQNGEVAQGPDAGSGVSVRLLTHNDATHAARNQISASAGTYDFSSAANCVLNVWLSIDNGATYGEIVISGIVGAAPAATTSAEIAAILNANPDFAEFFTASDSGGTLKVDFNMFSSRCKVYFTGAAATVLGTDFTTYIASGSARAGSTQAGSKQEFIVEDLYGNPVGNFPVYVRPLVGGSLSATCSVGLPDEGSIDLQQPIGTDNVKFYSDPSTGKLRFYVVDTAAETVVVTALPGAPAPNNYGANHKDTSSVIFS